MMPISEQHPKGYANDLAILSSTSAISRLINPVMTFQCTGQQQQKHCEFHGRFITDLQSIYFIWRRLATAATLCWCLPGIVSYIRKYDLSYAVLPPPQDDHKLWPEFSESTLYLIIILHLLLRGHINDNRQISEQQSQGGRRFTYGLRTVFLLLLVLIVLHWFSFHSFDLRPWWLWPDIAPALVNLSLLIGTSYIAETQRGGSANLIMPILLHYVNYFSVSWISDAADRVRVANRGMAVRGVFGYGWRGFRCICVHFK